MKKTITTLLIILIVSLLGYGVYNKYNKPVVEPSPIDLIMQRPEFQASMLLQAKNIHLNEQAKEIERQRGELRREELNLASTTRSLI